MHKANSDALLHELQLVLNVKMNRIIFYEGKNAPNEHKYEPKER
ncbi:MAG: hypothetical protein ACJ708_08435 [Nitrososphaeraceae archaeon]